MLRRTGLGEVLFGEIYMLILNLNDYEGAFSLTCISLSLCVFRNLLLWWFYEMIGSSDYLSPLRLGVDEDY